MVSLSLVGAARKPHAAWSLETSIWAGRAHGADSRTFWDTEEVMKRRFAHDWKTLLAYGLRKLILRFDDGDSDDSDSDGGAADGDETSDEVCDVEEALWRSQQMISRIFTLYAAAGGAIHSMPLNAWTEFVDDFKLGRPRSSDTKALLHTSTPDAHQSPHFSLAEG